jgi:predicted RND superfamily exporter protein
MGKLSLPKLVKDVRLTVAEHSPEILMGVGIAGMVSTTVLAVRATPKALRLIDEKKEEIENEVEHSVETIPPMEIVKACWKCYVPATITGTVSIACLIGANSINTRRNMALATAYALSETALKDYREKVVETIGEKKERTVRDAVAKEKLERDPVRNKEIIVTEKGNTRCYDVVSCRYFTSDIDKLKKIENELNRRMRDEMYISLNEFYYEIGLNPSKIGDDLGWNIDDGYIDLDFSSQLDDSGTPCLVVDYRVTPRYDYRRLL